MTAEVELGALTAEVELQSLAVLLAYPAIFGSGVSDPTVH